MDIIYLLKVLRRRQWFLWISLLIGVIGGVIFRLLLPKEYVSSAQYATGLYRTQKVSLQLNEIFDVNQIDYRLNNVIETFKSPTVLGMMSYDLLEHDLSSSRPFRTLTEKQRRDTIYSRADLQKAKDILREKM